MKGERCVCFYHTYLVDVQADFALDNSTSGGGNITFRGYVEGNGHTISITYTMEHSNAWAPFAALHGIVKNLKVKGSMQTERAIRAKGTAAFVKGVTNADEHHSYTDKTVYYNYPKFGKGPAAIFDGCVNEVTYSQEGTALFGANKARMSGFIDHITEGDTVIFNDCLFAGNIDTDKCERFGGFVCFKYEGVLLTLRNCVVDLSNAKAERKGDYAGYFIGWDEEAKNTSFSNCYYVPASSSISLEKPKNVPEAKKENLISGALTYTLAKGRVGDANPWAQTLGTDNQPRIKTISPKSLEVYYQSTGVTRQTTANGWSAFLCHTNRSFPSTVTAYTVTGLDEENKTVTVSPYSGSLKGVPLLLYTDGEAESYTVPTGYYNRPVTLGYLHAAYDATKSSDSYRVLSDGAFVKSESDIPAWNCYLSAANSDTYTIDKNGSTMGTICLISSNDAWNSFCTNYSGQNVTAYLTTDLTLTDDDKRIEEFVGTFDGQGHCITDNSSETSVFLKAQGTIKNLRVENLNEKCAVVGYVSGNINYVDCKAASALWLRTPITYDIKYSHVLYKTDQWCAAYGENASSQEVTEEQLANGYAAYHLNDGRTGDAAVWTQTIGEDTIPQLLSTTSKEVFHAATTTREATTDKWSTLYYPEYLDLSSLDGLRIFDDFGLANDTLFSYENLTGQLMPNTPAIIYCENGIPEIQLPETYYNKEVEDQGADIVGTYEATDVSNYCMLTTETAEDGTTAVLFAAPAAAESTTLPAWQCYTPDAAAVVNDGTVITSKDDWNKFKTRYNGREATVRLVGDLTLTADDEPMEHFKGTFNGTMATITLDGAQAPFKTAEGLIKQITVSGTPAEGSAAIVGTASGALELEDCCSTAGALITDADKVKFNSCLVLSTDETAPDDNTAYFDNDGKAEKVTAAQLKSGEATYRLNAGRTGDKAMWFQTIGSDSNPSVNSFTAKEVYLATDTVRLGSAGWATHYYPLACALPAGVKAFRLDGVITTDGESVVNLAEVKDTIPAYTPVLLCSLPDEETTEATQTYTIPMPGLYFNTLSVEVGTDDKAEKTQQFQLIGVADSLVTFDGCYVLQQHTDAAGKTHTAFYRVDESEACPVVPAWKCALLDINTFADSEDGTEEKTQAVHLRLDKGESTSISAINRILDEDAATYDLSGRRVKTLKKGGAYIKNGQKFIIK